MNVIQRKFSEHKRYGVSWDDAEAARKKPNEVHYGLLTGIQRLESRNWFLVDLVWRGEQKQVAKDLFGRPLRVALAAWIVSRDSDLFFLQQAQDALRPLGEAASGVAGELKRFEAHGMLYSTSDGRRVYYTVLDSPLWTVFEAAAVALGLLRPDHA